MKQESFIPMQFHESDHIRLNDLVRRKVCDPRMAVPFPYTTDIASAWLLVRRLHNRGFEFQARIYEPAKPLDAQYMAPHEEDRWQITEATFIRYDGPIPVSYRGCHHSIEIAICMAALKAVGAGDDLNTILETIEP